MPLQNLRFTFDQSTDISADRVVWTFGVDGDTVDTAEMTTLVSAFEAVLAETGSGTNPLSYYLQDGLTLLFGEAFPATGGPATGVAEGSGTPLGGGTNLPSEVAIVASRMVESPRGSTPGGRLYVGPLSDRTNNDGRPFPAAMDAVGDFMVLWAEDLILAGYSPELIRNNGTPGATGDSIQGYRVDNAFDTQRRRGWAPTSSEDYPGS